MLFLDHFRTPYLIHIRVLALNPAQPHAWTHKLPNQPAQLACLSVSLVFGPPMLGPVGFWGCHPRTSPGTHCSPGQDPETLGVLGVATGGQRENRPSDPSTLHDQSNNNESWQGWWPGDGSDSRENLGYVTSQHIWPES